MVALKSGDKLRTSALRLIASDLKKAAIDQGKDVVTGDDALAVLRRNVKTRTDSAEQYEKAGRTEAAQKERAEIAVIEEYLPKQASEEAIREVAKAVIAEKGLSGMAAMGVAIKETVARLGGAADGKVVSTIVGALLRAK